MKPDYYSPKDRAQEKQKSREEDQKNILSGKISPEELNKKNTFLSPKNGKINWKAAPKNGLW